MLCPQVGLWAEPWWRVRGAKTMNLKIILHYEDIFSQKLAPIFHFGPKEFAEKFIYASKHWSSSCWTCRTGRYDPTLYNAQNVIRLLLCSSL